MHSSMTNENIRAVLLAEVAPAVAGIKPLPEWVNVSRVCRRLGFEPVGIEQEQWAAGAVQSAMDELKAEGRLNYKTPADTKRIQVWAGNA